MSQASIRAHRAAPPPRRELTAARVGGDLAEPARAGLRFCLLTTFYPPWTFGGDGIQVRRLARALAGRGHEVTVVCSPLVHRVLSRERAAPAPEDPGVEVVRLSENLASLTGTYLTGKPMRARRQLEAVLERGFDVLHYHNPSLIGAPALLGMGTGVKLYTAHEQWLVCPSHVLWKRSGRACLNPPCRTCEISHLRPPQPWRHTPLLRRSLAELDALICPSRTSASLHERFASTVRIEVIPHFVPEPVAGSDGAGDGHAGRPYFLYAGRLEPIKGVETLLDAFRRRRSEDLVIAGDGGLARRLRRRAADLPHVRFTGWLSSDRLDELYRGALAVLVPTRGHEAFGLVAAEAFARARAAIVHRFGALGELVEETGAAIGYRTPAELEAALELIASDPERRLELGRRGRAAHLRQFSAHGHLHRYLSVVGRAARERGDAELASAADVAAGASVAETAAPGGDAAGTSVA